MKPLEITIPGFEVVELIETYREISLISISEIIKQIQRVITSLTISISYIWFFTLCLQNSGGQTQH